MPLHDQESKRAKLAMLSGSFLKTRWQISYLLPGLAWPWPVTDTSSAVIGHCSFHATGSTLFLNYCLNCRSTSIVNHTVVLTSVYCIAVRKLLSSWHFCGTIIQTGIGWPECSAFTPHVLISGYNIQGWFKKSHHSQIFVPSKWSKHMIRDSKNRDVRKSQYSSLFNASCTVAGFCWERHKVSHPPTTKIWRLLPAPLNCKQHSHFIHLSAMPTPSLQTQFIITQTHWNGTVLNYLAKRNANIRPKKLSVVLTIFTDYLLDYWGLYQDLTRSWVCCNRLYSFF